MSDSAFSLIGGPLKSGAVLQTGLLEPTGTTVITYPGVMMGLGGSAQLTPTASGSILVIINGECYNNTASGGVQFTLRYGTGLPPVNGAASAGGMLGPLETYRDATAGNGTPFSISGVITGATLGTAYWFDLCLNSLGAGALGAVRHISVTAYEIGGPQGPAGAPGGVTSVFGRVGVVTAQQSDYDSFFLTPAEGDAAYQPIGTGLPTGGAAGDTLIKNTATNYDASWKSGPGTNLSYKQVGAGTSTSASGVMMGVGASGWRLTPRRSGLVLLIVSGSFSHSVAGAVATCGFRFGTGTAPAYQAAGIGTPAGGTISHNSAAANYQGDLSTCALVSGLAIGTDYWFDLILITGTATATINSPIFYAVEL